MNWFRYKERSKGSGDIIEVITSQSLENMTAWNTFKAIQDD